jgi:hypothetical protein
MTPARSTTVASSGGCSDRNGNGRDTPRLYADSSAPDGATPSPHDLDDAAGPMGSRVSVQSMANGMPTTDQKNGGGTMARAATRMANGSRRCRVYLLRRLAAAPEQLLTTIRRVIELKRHPPWTIEEYLERLERAGTHRIPPAVVGRRDRHPQDGRGP